MFIYFPTRFSKFTNWKPDSYNWILVIIYYFTHIILYYEVKTHINIEKWAQVIIYLFIRHYIISSGIMSNGDVQILSRFLLSPCYFFIWKWKIFTNIFTLIKNHIIMPLGRIYVYFCIFVNWEKKNCVKLLLKVKFAYNIIIDKIRLQAIYLFASILILSFYLF